MLFTKTLEKRISKYNGDIEVIQSLGMGIYIKADGLTQSGGIVESIWKSTLKKISMDCKNILILGLGGGTLAKLLRKKYPLAKITGVEIDSVMIELGKKYLNLDKYNVHVKIEDATRFKLNKYDLVIVDCYLGDKYVDVLSINLVKSKIVIFNRHLPGSDKKEALKFGDKLKKIFKKVEIFYPPANLMFFCRNYGPEE